VTHLEAGLLNSVPQHTGPLQDQDPRRVLKRLLEVHRPLWSFSLLSLQQMRGE
jgi:hypothetical protein